MKYFVISMTRSCLAAHLGGAGTIVHLARGHVIHVSHLVPSQTCRCRQDVLIPGPPLDSALNHCSTRSHFFVVHLLGVLSVLAGNTPSNMPIIDPHDLVGCTFLLPQQEDGQCFCTHIVKALDDYESDLGTQPDCIHFLCSAKDGKFEEILSDSVSCQSRVTWIRGYFPNAS
jgi:hypothetical protein